MNCDRTRLLLSTGLAVLHLLSSQARGQCANELASRSQSGVSGNNSSAAPAATPDGRWVVFSSRATTLTNQPATTFAQIFLRDGSNGAVTMLSVSPAGVPGNENSSVPEISNDGTRVTFQSSATNLVPNDTNGRRDVFLRDLLTQTTTRVNVSTSGAQSSADAAFHALSPCGRFVSFWSTDEELVAADSNGVGDVFLRDLLTGTLEIVSLGSGGVQGDDDSTKSSISAGGRFVAFSSLAGNLAPNDTNGFGDCFVRDRLLGTTTLVSVPASGGLAGGGTSDPRISADGSTVVFWGAVDNLVPNDTNGAWDVFVRDLAGGTTERVSVASDGVQGNGNSSSAYISADGRFVVFSSLASNLTEGDTNGRWDVFRHDRRTGRTRVLTRSPAGVPGNGDSFAQAPCSVDGRRVAVSSQASNLVANDNNNFEDVFLLDCIELSVDTYCTAKLNSLLCLPQIDHAGFASASGTMSFSVTARDVINQRNGLLFYGAGPTAAPFQGGFKCVRDPVRRTPLQSSSGSPSGADCTGSFAFDFGAWIASGADATLEPGAVVFCQYWFRDAAHFSGTGLTDGLEFTILP